MSKYDNSQVWEAYRNKFLLAFIKEFSTELQLGATGVVDFYEVCKSLSYEDMQSEVTRNSVNYVPLEKLRTRFRTYAYKSRRNLSSISISRSTKEKLDKLIEKDGFADHDYSDVIEHLCRSYLPER